MCVIWNEVPKSSVYRKYIINQLISIHTDIARNIHTILASSLYFFYFKKIWTEIMPLEGKTENRNFCVAYVSIRNLSYFVYGKILSIPYNKCNLCGLLRFNVCFLSCYAVRATVEHNFFFIYNNLFSR